MSQGESEEEKIIKEGMLYHTIHEFIENSCKIALIGNILFQSPIHAYP